MGILNITPDSFSDGGSFFNAERAYQRALEIEREGADIIDIGGESTRPGSSGISVKEELKRVMPVLKKIKKALRIPISVDTTKAEVAEAALSEGAAIINDVSGLRSDKRIASLCARYSAGLVIMHIKGTPRTMQKRPYYKNVLFEIASFFKRAIAIAREQGLSRDQIIIDPGIGFGKRLKHNLTIIASLGYFKRLRLPIMIGLSRKSFLKDLLGLEIQQRLAPTIAAHALAIYNGADIIRVHDVRGAALTARLVDAVKTIANH